MVKRKRYLNNYTDVKRYLADIAYRLEIGELDTKTALALKDICNGVTYVLIQETHDKEVEALRENNELMTNLVKQMQEVKKG